MPRFVLAVPAPRLRLAALTVIAALALAACQSSEERAERHYQSALSYMAEGEVELALVDLRRVFDYDGFHKKARALYAATVRERGELQEAYGQYLRLVEQFPDTPEARIALGEMAFLRNDWEEVERHGSEAVELVPDDPAAQALGAALAFRAAALAEDAAAQDAAADVARAVLDTAPDNQIARRLLISHLLASDRPADALPEIDRVLAADPENLQLHFARLDLIARAEDEPGVAAQLNRMFELFPESEEVQEAVLRWHAARGELAEAEAILRAVADLTPDDAEGYLNVMRFLQQTQGESAAMAELDALIDAATDTPNGDLYRAVRAALIFDAGAIDEAIAELRAIIANAGDAPTDQTRDFQVMLAQMLVSSADEPGARALIEEIVAADPTHVEALKMRAAWAIGEDRAGEAITDLRAALGQAPRDAELLTLMATAHEREGSLELAGERLALAVEASGGAVEESLRYAQFLLAQGRTATAEQVLTDGLRANPGDLEIIALLAELFVAEGNWGEAANLRAELEDRAEPQAEAIAETLDTAILLSQDRASEAEAMLESQIAESGLDGDRRATAILALIRTREGDIDGARAAIEEAMERNPEDMAMRMLDISLDLSTGAGDAAEIKLRGIIAEVPGAERPIQQLFSYLNTVGREADAIDLIATELERAPSSRYLRLVHGALLAERGEIDAAITLYDALYAENTSDVVVANNLASLLATHRFDDAEALARADAVARRLRDRDVPAFQDTYGWITFLRGDAETALPYLEAAATGLPEDALVQYHLGRVYEALARTDDARIQYDRALALAEGTDIAALPQFDTARDRLAALPLGEETDTTAQ